MLLVEQRRTAEARVGMEDQGLMGLEGAGLGHRRTAPMHHRAELASLGLVGRGHTAAHAGVGRSGRGYLTNTVGQVAGDGGVAATT